MKIEKIEMYERKKKLISDQKRIIHVHKIDAIKKEKRLENEINGNGNPRNCQSRQILYHLSDKGLVNQNIRCNKNPKA